MTAPTSNRAPVILHRVTSWDSAFLYELTCDPEVRAQSLTPWTPTIEQHGGWLKQFLTDPYRYGWVVLYQHERAAFVWLEHNGRLGARISVAVLPKYRVLGVGKAAIYHATLFAHNHEWLTLASIKPENVASIKAFEACGYTLVGPAIEAAQDVVVYAHD